jgi:hypothetical protein
MRCEPRAAAQPFFYALFHFVAVLVESLPVSHQPDEQEDKEPDPEPAETHRNDSSGKPEEVLVRHATPSSCS